jgi:hypothetical protein
MQPSDKSKPSHDPLFPSYARVTDGMRLVDDLRTSGLSQAEFARQRGIGEKKVSYWVRRIRALSAAAKVHEPPKLVHVATVTDDGAVITPAVSPPAPASLPKPALSLSGPVAIEIRLEGGRTIAVGPGFDRDVLRSVVELLEGVSPCST